MLTGVLSGSHKIIIADGATITLKDANITCLDSGAYYAGINPLGDATILLEGENTIKGGNEEYPGIYAPENKTLTIDGDGSLDASSNGWGCGIGGGCDISCGNIIIKGGTIIARGGSGAAGIGSGIGANCGNIEIMDTVTKVTAQTDSADYSIGADSGTCGTVTIGGVEVGPVRGRYYTYQPN